MLRMETLAHRGEHRIRAHDRAGARSRCGAGFTFVEMMVSLTITSLLAMLAVPWLGSFVDAAQLTSAANGFVASLQLARSEAIKRNHRVVLCKSADGIACAVSGAWEQGWIIFDDEDNNGSRGGAEELLHRQVALPSGLRLTGNLHVASYVAFVPTGVTKLVGGGFQAGTLTLCHQSLPSPEARQIILNAVGRPRVQRLSVSTCL